MENMKHPQDWTQVAEIELIYKTNIKPSMRPVIKTSADGYNAFLQHWDKNQIEFVEKFKVMLLNRSNKVLGIYEASTGNAYACIVDPKLVLCAAIKANACSIILCHNHPSGHLQPSQADRELTSKIREAARFLDMKVLDHLIISEEGYYSFADEGIL